LGLFTTLFKTAVTLSPSHTSRYRASVKLKDACLTLKSTYGYKVLRSSWGTLSEIDSHTDITQMSYVCQAVSRKHNLKLLIIGDDMFLNKQNYPYLLSSTLPRLPNNKSLHLFFDQFQIAYIEHSWLTFHPNIVEPHREKSQLEIIREVTNFEESLAALLGATQEQQRMLERCNYCGCNLRITLLFDPNEMGDPVCNDCREEHFR
jgi:hypothetical protein